MEGFLKRLSPVMASNLVYLKVDTNKGDHLNGVQPF